MVSVVAADGATVNAADGWPAMALSVPGGVSV